MQHDYRTIRVGVLLVGYRGGPDEEGAKDQGWRREGPGWAAEPGAGGGGLGRGILGGGDGAAPGCWVYKQSYREVGGGGSSRNATVAAAATTPNLTIRLLINPAARSGTIAPTENATTEAAATRIELGSPSWSFSPPPLILCSLFIWATSISNWEYTDTNYPIAMLHAPNTMPSSPRTAWPLRRPP